MAINNFFFQSCVLLVFIILICHVTQAQSNIKFFNVKDYGATADGNTDNSQAFLKAWSEACHWDGRKRVLIPEGTFMVNPVIFEGPCIGCMDFQIKGVLKASTDPSFIFVENWINFRYVHNLAIFGGGQLDGQGQVAWPYNDCHKNPNCRLLSTSMRFDFITNGIVHDIKSINSKSGHFILFGCENINMTKVKISAPSDSPNTDGIKISNSYGIRIRNVNIGTGDDCIAMISGTRKVRISRVTCGPGHGISVGSLGKDDGEEDVEDIVVRNCTFYGTSDGLRIKTWAAPLSKPLKASNLVYDDVVFYNVGNPIIIDQQYCPHPPCMGQVESSEVQISGVKYKNIRGSCNSEVAVTFRCSEKKPCQSITMEDVTIWPGNNGGGDAKLTNLCTNVNGDSFGKQSPPSCL